MQVLVDSAPTPIRCLVIDASPITDIDFSAASDLRDLFTALRARHVTVVFGRVSSYLRADMDRHRITPVIGAANIHAQLHTAIAAAQKIMADGGP